MSAHSQDSSGGGSDEDARPAITYLSKGHPTIRQVRLNCDSTINKQGRIHVDLDGQGAGVGWTAGRVGRSCRSA